MIHALKLRTKLLLIFFKDLVSLHYFQFSKKTNQPPNFEHAYSFALEIKPGPTFDNKAFNLRLASQRISRHVILPGQLFSFWKAVGNPNHQFKESRSIVDGQLKAQKGGGLCQVSGIVYYACIRAGLQVLERHNHSIDIYQDHERFTPLGTDATVVFGNKDLRVRNNLKTPIQFLLSVNQNQLTITLKSQQPISPKKLYFFTTEHPTERIVEVKDQHNNTVNRSVYKKL